MVPQTIQLTRNSNTGTSSTSTFHHTVRLLSRWMHTPIVSSKASIAPCSYVTRYGPLQCFRHLIHRNRPKKHNYRNRHLNPAPKARSKFKYQGAATLSREPSASCFSVKFQIVYSSILQVVFIHKFSRLHKWALSSLERPAREPFSSLKRLNGNIHACMTFWVFSENLF